MLITVAESSEERPRMNGFRTAQARDVRTGDVITNDYADRGLTLTVDYPTWERFTNPEGQTSDVIRFTGVDSWGRRHDKGWGQSPDGRVYIAC